MSKTLVVTALGITQIFAWGSSFYLLTVLGAPIAQDTGWTLSWTISGLSLGLLLAGFVAPLSGRLIQSLGGRMVLCAGSVLIGSGQLMLAFSHSFTAYLVSWCVIGIGMSMGLYDAAFATLGRSYGTAARSAISDLTLFGGFASTICWPLSALMVEKFGWREACMIYAAIQFLLALPLHFLMLPRGESAAPAHAGHDAERAGNSSSGQGDRLSFALIAAIVSLIALVASVLSVHLVDILQANGRSLAVAVAVAAMMGPSQVAARIVERIFAQRLHPLWTMLASTLLITAGIALMAADVVWPGLALALFGAGNGIGSIARGALPLVFFGPANYALIMGRIAFPAFIAQAIAPALGALAIERWGGFAALAGLACLAAIAVALTIWLFLITRREAQ